LIYLLDTLQIKTATFPFLFRDTQTRLCTLVITGYGVLEMLLSYNLMYMHTLYSQKKLKISVSVS